PLNVGEHICKWQSHSWRWWQDWYFPSRSRWSSRNSSLGKCFGSSSLRRPCGFATSNHGSRLRSLMIFLKYLLILGGAGMIAAAISLLARDLYLNIKHRQALLSSVTPTPEAPETHWRQALAFGVLAFVPIILALGIVVVPTGTGGVRVSQSSGTEPGTLYPGAHLITPLAESVVLFDTRDQLFTTGTVEDGKAASTKPTQNADLMRVQSKEGLELGLAITIRYRLDPKHLDYIQANLPQPIEREIVPPVVARFAWM